MIAPSTPPNAPTAAVAGVLVKRGVSEEHALAIAIATISSIWITAIGLGAGALAQSWFDGVRDPRGLIGWVHDGHLYGFLIGQVVVPAVRARWTWIKLPRTDGEPPAP